MCTIGYPVEFMLYRLALQMHLQTKEGATMSEISKHVHNRIVEDSDIKITMIVEDNRNVL